MPRAVHNPDAMPGLELEDVSHRYDADWAVRELSFGVDKGEIVCLLGPSGCGKTTVLRLAAGLEPLQAGQVRLGGRLVAEGGNLRQVPPEARGVGLMFQDYALFPHLTVRENVTFGVPRSDARRGAWVPEVLDEMGLGDFADRYPHTLSGGQQQRIALLRALAPRPQVLLLDEPFSGLDEHLRQQIRVETLRRLQGSKASTLMVTHDPEEAMFLADRIVVLDRGRLVQDAVPIEIFERPADPFVARLFGPINEFKGVVRAGQVETPLGMIAAAGFEDGSAVLVMVRASDVEVLGDGDGSGPSITARVRSARPLGLQSELRLGAGHDGIREEIQVRIPGLVLPGEGTELRLVVREERAFVYPR